MKKCWLYKLINTKTNMFYVGLSTQPAWRERDHVLQLKRGEHASKRLQQAWDEQKGEGFVFELSEVKNFDKAEEEVSTILSALPQWCYNVPTSEFTPHKGKFGADHPCGGPKSEEHVKKISEGVRAYYQTHDHAMKGVPRTAEDREKMSKAQMGHVVSLETREKMRKMYTGRVWTEEQKDKLRKPKGRTAEHAAKFNKAIIEVTSGRRFESLKAVKEHYGISPGFLAKCLAKDAPLKKGEMKGLHFRYADVK